MARNYAHVECFQYYDDLTGEWVRIKYGPKSKGSDYKIKTAGGFAVRVVHKVKKGYQGPSWFVVSNEHVLPATMPRWYKAVKITQKAA